MPHLGLSVAGALMPSDRVGHFRAQPFAKFVAAHRGRAGLDDVGRADSVHEEAVDRRFDPFGLPREPETFAQHH